MTIQVRDNDKLNEEQIIAVIIALPFVVTFLWILLTFK